MKEPTRYLVLTGLFLGVLLSGLVFIRQQTGKQAALSSSLATSSDQQQVATLVRPYRVPRKERQDQHYQVDGHLKELGDFTYQAAGQRIELIGQTKLDQTVKSGQVDYRLEQVQYYANVARTTAALEQAKKLFKHGQLPREFTTLLLVYEIKNTGSARIKTAGLAAVTLPDGQVVSPIKGLYNDPTLAKHSLAVGKAKQTYALLLVPKKSLQQLQPLRLDMATIYQSDNQPVKTQPFRVTVAF